MIQNIEAKDGEYEIVYSNIFNIYDDRLRITINGLKIVLIFEEKEGENPIYSIKGGTEESTITLVNMRNPLGSAMTERAPIISLEDGRKIYISLYAQSVGGNTKCLQVSITFYKK